MQYDKKEIERKAIAVTGLYVAVISCVIITITGIVMGYDLLSVLIRAVIVLFLTWPTGCFFGYLGFKIFEESLGPEESSEPQEGAVEDNNEVEEENKE